MAAPLLLRGARQLLTLRESRGSRSGSPKDQLGIVEDGSLLVVEGAIAEVGVWRRLGNLNRARGAAQCDASGCVVMPGFLDGLADLFTEPISPTILRKRIRTLHAHGITAAAYSKPGNPRQLHLAQALGLDVHPARDPVLPLRSFCARQPCVWPDQATLGTGFDGHTHLACSMQAAISIACLTASVSIEDAILAATVWGARRLGLADRLGSLSPGHQADFILLDVPDYRQIPYHLGENLVRAVFKRGVKVYQRGDPYWAGDS